eukprot:m.100156 g.100156  ORF g.100156 m.100156 type:complete len:69 (-) comp14050_c0_seq7:2778-2984(-)
MRIVFVFVHKQQLAPSASWSSESSEKSSLSCSGFFIPHSALNASTRCTPSTSTKRDFMSPTLPTTTTT